MTLTKPTTIQRLFRAWDDHHKTSNHEPEAEYEIDLNPPHIYRSQCGWEHDLEPDTDYAAIELKADPDQETRT